MGKRYKQLSLEERIPIHAQLDGVGVRRQLPPEFNGRPCSPPLPFSSTLPKAVGPTAGGQRVISTGPGRPCSPPLPFSSTLPKAVGPTAVCNTLVTDISTD